MIALRDISMTFKQNKAEFCKNPQHWLHNHGANAAGVLWNTGNAAQLLLGTFTYSPRIITASFFNFASATSMMVFGKKSWGVAANAALGVAGTALTLYPALNNGDMATIAGFSVFVGAEIFGLFNACLSKKFIEADSRVVRETLGSPRRMQGGIIFLSRIPVITSAALRGDISTLIPFLLWASGDLSLALSEKPKIRGPKAIAPAR